MILLGSLGRNIQVRYPISFSKLNGKDLIETTDFISPGTSTELARVVSADIDRKKLGVNKSRIRLGSGTKNDLSFRIS